MNILCVTDKKGRIQYNRCCELKKYLPKEHNIDVIALDEFKQKKDINIKKYDVVYYAHFSLYGKFKVWRKLACLCSSVTSHKCLDNLDKTLANLRQFDRISVNNTYLFDAFQPHIKNLHYTPNGVDTSLFSFADKFLGDPIVFGWVGNKDREVKNYNKILRPLIELKRDVAFNIIATKKSDPGYSLRNSSEMAHYYQNIDFYLVTSSAEGTPNPALEAMSCGTPVISTKVGNMTDIINNGKNGFLVSEDIKKFNKIMDEVMDMSEHEYCKMRQKTREYILSWDWKIQSKKWIKFLVGH